MMLAIFLIFGVAINSKVVKCQYDWERSDNYYDREPQKPNYVFRVLLMIFVLLVITIFMTIIGCCLNSVCKILLDVSETNEECKLV